jgi:hypothetical protein
MRRKVPRSPAKLRATSTTARCKTHPDSRATATNSQVSGRLPVPAFRTRSCLRTALVWKPPVARTIRQPTRQGSWRKVAHPLLPPHFGLTPWWSQDLDETTAWLRKRRALLSTASPIMTKQYLDQELIGEYPLSSPAYCPRLLLYRSPSRHFRASTPWDPVILTMAALQVLVARSPQDVRLRTRPGFRASSIDPNPLTRCLRSKILTSPAVFFTTAVLPAACRRFPPSSRLWGLDTTLMTWARTIRAWCHRCQLHLLRLLDTSSASRRLVHWDRTLTVSRSRLIVKAACLQPPRVPPLSRALSQRSHLHLVIGAALKRTSLEPRRNPICMLSRSRLIVLAVPSLAQTVPLLPRAQSRRYLIRRVRVRT